jgi:hypothetical protein
MIDRRYPFQESFPEILEEQMNDQDAAVEKMASELIAILERHQKADFIDRVFQVALKKCREKRYFDRGPAMPAMDEQSWLPVLRAGYEQYRVSDWGFVRNINRGSILRPAFEHQYARAPMNAANRASGKPGGHQHMIHELVYESFKLKKTLVSFGIKKGIEIINHLDEDKWNPHVNNLELTDQVQNMLHFHFKRR